MSIRRSLLGLLAVLPALGVGGGERSDLGACLSEPIGAERLRCLEAGLSAQPAADEDLVLLERLIDEDPAGVERLARVAEATIVGIEGSPDSGPGGREPLRARLHELRGEALFRMGRPEAAAEAFRSAVAIDDGMTRLTWLVEGGRPAWSVALDPGEGRYERAARVLLALGRKEETRQLLERALVSGASGWPVEAWGSLGGGQVPGLDPSPSALSAPTWFPPLPDLEVKLMEGEPFRLASARGKVLILDFWASWCAPCLRELPRLQALYDAHRHLGLAAVTINARESVITAESAADGLGLKLPIGFYDSSLDRAFSVRSLPTVVLADRNGRIRARWDTHVPDYEEEIAGRVRSLLGDDPEGAPRKIADVLAGGGLFQIEWTRELAATIGGMAVSPAAGGGQRIALVSGGQLLSLEPDGKVETRYRLPAGAGRLCRSAAEGEGRFELVSFRPGGKEVLRIDTRDGKARVWTAPAPILDLAVLTPRPAPSSGGRWMIGSVDGLELADPDGQTAHWAEGAGETCAVGISGSGSTMRAVALTTAGQLRWFDLAGRVLAESRAPRGSWKLVLAGPTAGVGVVPASVSAVASGRFLGTGSAQVALATASGQLVVVDTASGEARFRARWPGITELGSGDLDGDGQDELLVAADRSITVVKAIAAAPPPAKAAGE